LEAINIIGFDRNGEPELREAETGGLELMFMLGEHP
jgi:hypothetical protein